MSMKPQSLVRVEWELAVVDILIRMDMSRGDAQAVMEAADDLVDDHFAKGSTPDQCASALMAD